MQAMFGVPQTAKTVHAGTSIANGFALLVEALPQSPQDTFVSCKRWLCHRLLDFSYRFREK